MHLEHTCVPSGKGCKVNAEWFAKTYENTIRTDPTTKIDTLVENGKLKYGVPVPRSIAYMAKNEDMRVVLVDHTQQYKRLRDFLNTVIDTNFASRCIVTTKVVTKHPSPNPRFHGIFMCLNASIEGF